MLMMHYDESYMPWNDEHVSCHTMMTVHDTEVHTSYVMNTYHTLMHAASAISLIVAFTNAEWQEFDKEDAPRCGHRMRMRYV